mgnify:FL=1|tara:strand:+ start:224 stop:409 length:186 start_codon:yes stop_codon:yes gene_type:complete
MAKTNEVPVDKYSTKSTMGEGKIDIGPFTTVVKETYKAVKQALSSDRVQKDDVVTTYSKGK